MEGAAINRFDTTLIQALNARVGTSPLCDNLIEFLSGNDLVKGALIIGLCWWYWFRQTDAATRQETRERLVCTLLAGIVGIVLARILALTLPFRMRPRFEPSLHFVLPKGAASVDIWNWSSFPSDHAVMFAALAGGIFFISRRMGVLALLYAIFVIGLPRVYLGFHYPTDILVGVVLGVVCAYCMNLKAIRSRIAGKVVSWEYTSPGAFYVSLFILSFLFATMFNSLRDCAQAASHLGAKFITQL
jgi:undecaprenyl-diphosphatase